MGREELHSDSEDDATTLLSRQHVSRSQHRSRQKWIWKHLPLMFSCVLNIFLSIYILRIQGRGDILETRFAELKRDQEQPWRPNSEFSNPIPAEALETWNSINFDRGIVALSQDYTNARGIPNSQPFPWDQSKGIYVLNGFHSLHCIQSIARTVFELKAGQKESHHFEHVAHCLHAIRDEILCNADDTPRYTDQSNNPESGVGQTRQCRSWDALEQWAEKNTACYKYINESANQWEDQLQRFKFCPPDSEYIPKVKEYFGDD